MYYAQSSQEEMAMTRVLSLQEGLRETTLATNP
jgi:hypothetical protein